MLGSQGFVPFNAGDGGNAAQVGVTHSIVVIMHKYTYIHTLLYIHTYIHACIQHKQMHGMGGGGMMNMQESAASNNDVGYYARSWGTPSHTYTHIHTYKYIHTFAFLIYIPIVVYKYH